MKGIKLEEGEDPANLLVKNERERVIGMLHAFLLLRPIIEKSLAKEEHNVIKTL